MDTVKKNMLSIVCGVVAIAAVVAWFWPVGGMYGQLESDLQARAKTYEDVETLRKAERNLPSLVLESSEKPVLDRFPNQKVIDEGERKTKALTEQSERMLKTVADRNVRQPLVPKSLPIAEPGARAAFPNRYLQELGAIEKTAGAGLPNFDMGLPKKLNATRPPYPEELMEMVQKLWDDEFSKRVLTIGGDSNLETVTQDFYEKIRNLPETERQRRADQHRVYLDEGSLPQSTEIVRGKQPTDTQIWFAQTALWITEDVVNAINAANKGSKSVRTSPVKHLVSLRVPFGPAQYVLGTAGPAGPDGVAAALPADANGVPQVFTMSPTGRVCNPVYDVIHFELVLRADFSKVPQVIAEVERNRLFTVLSTGVTSVDAQAEYNELGYVYGNDPVAELTLQCEALFLRSWTVDADNKEKPYKNALMPTQVRQSVGAEQGPGVQAGGAGAGEPGYPEENMPAEQY